MIVTGCRHCLYLRPASCIPYFSYPFLLFSLDTTAALWKQACPSFNILPVLKNTFTALLVKPF